MAGPSFGCIADIFDAVAARLAADGNTFVFGLGKYLLSQRGDPNAGRVIMIPSDKPSKLGAPRLMGGNPRPTYTINQLLEIHCWAKAPTQTDPATQYKADLKAAEGLRNVVLDVFEIFIPGAKRGGMTWVPYVGENISGVEVVALIGVDIETPDVTYELADGATFNPTVELEFTHGSSNPADFTFDTGQ